MTGEKSLVLSLIILGGGALLFFAFRPKDDGSARMEFLPTRKRLPMEKPTINDEFLQDNRLRQAYLCICEYIDKYNAGSTETELENVKAAFKKEFGFIIYQDEKLRLCVKDLQDAPVLIHKD